MKYNREHYDNPEYLWTDTVSEEELRKRYQEYLDDGNLGGYHNFDEWLDAEEYFEQEFAVRNEKV
jgi:predicted aminopeptidase